jgi:hypothetical protein
MEVKFSATHPLWVPQSELESHRRIEEEISSLPPPPADDALFQLITILANYKKHLVVENSVRPY